MANTKTRPAKRRKGWHPPTEREVIGTYETSGLPVYEGDDYVTDVEGCYLTRDEANALLAEIAEQAPALTPFCHRRPACQNPNCRYQIPCEAATLQPPK